MMSGLLLIGILLVPAHNITAMDIADYPASASAYEQGAVVTIDRLMLASLADEQLRALLQFTSSCGRVLLVDVSPSVADIFRDTAACKGLYLRAAAVTDDLPALVLDLQKLPIPSRATQAQLKDLLGASARGAGKLKQLGLFWSAYVLLLIFLLLNNRTRLTALGFGAAAALLVPVLWPPQETRSLVAWAEATTDDRNAAYFSLRHNASFLAGEFRSASEPDRGSFKLNPAVGFELRGDAVVVCNRGSSTLVTSHVYWRGAVFKLPDIAAGNSWTSSSKSPLDSAATATPELKLFSLRSQQHELTFLNPLPVSDVGGHGWLLLYAAAGKDRIPCD